MRLDAGLKNRYTIERTLGEGGMAVVSSPTMNGMIVR
jgi:hypothetical protein